MATKISHEEMAMLMKDEELAEKLYLLNVVASWASARVLNYLLKAGPEKIENIAAATKLNASDVLDILKELESVGVIISDFREKERAKYWRVKNGRFRIYLEGDSSGIHIRYAPIGQTSFSSRLLSCWRSFLR